MLAGEGRARSLVDGRQPKRDTVDVKAEHLPGFAVLGNRRHFAGSCPRGLLQLALLRPVVDAQALAHPLQDCIAGAVIADRAILSHRRQ